MLQHVGKDRAVSNVWSTEDLLSLCSVAPDNQDGIQTDSCQTCLFHHHYSWCVGTTCVSPYKVAEETMVFFSCCLDDKRGTTLL